MSIFENYLYTRGCPPVYARVFESVECNVSYNEINELNYCKYGLYLRFDRGVTWMLENIENNFRKGPN